jgi:L-threonylcarbamoyladenylate synthase
LSEWVAEVPPAARDLIASFWPGPLTLVLTARADVPRSVTADQDTVAIRQPAHPVCLALLRRFGRAVVAPSANRYMSISPTSAEHVARQFPDTDLLILDGGPCRVGVESTIVSLLPDEPPRLLRPGMVGREAIERVLDRPLALGADAAIRVPGQHDRHYAPTRPAWRFANIDPAARNDPRLGWLTCGDSRAVAGTLLDLGSDPEAYARRFYAALYRLDHADLDAILVQIPPEEESWRAIRDRIFRATRPYQPEQPQ